MALPSDEAIKLAMDYGLKIRYQRTCCSVSHDFSKRRVVILPKSTNRYHLDMIFPHAVT